MQPDIDQALRFLDMLEPNGRHTIASEAPFGNDGKPKWEGGATYEAHQRNLLIDDIIERQKRGSNVYYSVNRPCSIGKRTGFFGKNNIDDIIAIRALAFDIDFTCAKTEELIVALSSFIGEKLVYDLRPSLVISTGGGYQLIYILKKFISIKLYRPATNEDQELINKDIINQRMWITTLASEFEKYLRSIVPATLPIKVDNMSNVDRVMRLPGTINYPKAEKIAKGQVPAMAHIMNNYEHKCCIQDLRKQIPQIEVARRAQVNTAFFSRKNKNWPPARKAMACCEFICEQGLADSNEWYTINVMLPLIGAIHDPDDNYTITEAEAEECFMLAVSGGARYGTIGRGPGYFMRQWKSHRPELARNGTKSLGGLIHACKKEGMELPWKGEVMWEEEYNAMMKIANEERNIVSSETVTLLKDYV
jgi:hypothetical protein